MQELENLKYIVGRMIHYLRTGKGWTQQQLADAADLKRTTISNIESGRQSLALEQFCLIATVLDAKADDLLGTALRRLYTEDRWHTVERVITESNVKEKAVREHILDALK